jgi:hypothetical protein
MMIMMGVTPRGLGRSGEHSEELEGSMTWVTARRLGDTEFECHGIRRPSPRTSLYYTHFASGISTSERAPRNHHGIVEHGQISSGGMPSRFDPPGHMTSSTDSSPGLYQMADHMQCYAARATVSVSLTAYRLVLYPVGGHPTRGWASRSARLVLHYIPTT